ncbi:MAG: Hsp70 family protein [Candidatus Kerfeldbacteria bacterium]|nr:Hsp70 family protein [Candidatus Kerfeldbacteria bacterium]
MDHITYGLDFGTTNSAIAYLNNGEVEIVPVGLGGAETMKSVLFFPEEKIFPIIGDEGVQTYISSGMQGRLLQSIKAILPDEAFEGTIIKGNYYEIEDLVSRIMITLKKAADAAVGQNVKSVIIGRPARFSTNPHEEMVAERRLIEAARRAGFTDIQTQLEPIAAALSYEHTLSKAEIVMVADLGGGTSDFTIMQLGPHRNKGEDRKSDILSTGGVYIGGDRFDSIIMRNHLIKYFGANLKWQSWEKWLDLPSHIVKQLCEWHRITFLKNPEDMEFIRRLATCSDDPESSLRLQALIEENLGYSLFRAIERAKCHLSEAEKAQIKFFHSRIKIKETILRSAFSDDIRDEAHQVVNCAKTVLSDAGLKPTDIHTVFMTGGTSYVPLLRQEITQIFGRDIIRNEHVFTSVVRGLALSAK